MRMPRSFYAHSPSSPYLPFYHRCAIREKARRRNRSLVGSNHRASPTTPWKAVTPAPKPTSAPQSTLPTSSPPLVSNPPATTAPSSSASPCTKSGSSRDKSSVEILNTAGKAVTLRFTDRRHHRPSRTAVPHRSTHDLPRLRHASRRPGPQGQDRRLLQQHPRRSGTRRPRNLREPPSSRARSSRRCR